MNGNSYDWKYNKKLLRGALSCALIASGSFLLLEHLLTFEGFDVELIGHEYYGIVMIIIGFLIGIKWKQLSAFIKALKESNWRKILDEGER